MKNYKKYNEQKNSENMVTKAQEKLWKEFKEKLEGDHKGNCFYMILQILDQER